MRRLLLPVLCLGAAFAAHKIPQIPILPADSAMVRQASVVVFGVSFLLAARFRRGRVAYAMLLLLAVSQGLREDPSRLDLVAVLLPLNLALLAWMADWRIFSVAGGVRLAALGAQVLAVLWLSGGAASGNAAPAAEADGGAWAMQSAGALGTAATMKVNGWLATPLLDPQPGWLASLAMPQAALLAFLLAALAVGLRFLRPPTALDGGFLGALVASAAAVESSQTTFYLVVAGLILGLSLVDGAFSLAFEDALTGLPARRALEETLVHLGRTYAIAMVDLDHFKQFNDKHGHEVGDQVLQMVAAKLGQVRGGGEAYRYGGEEFSVVFAGKSAQDAKPFLEELCSGIAASDFVVRSPGRPTKKPKGKTTGRSTGKQAGTKTLKVTVSIGVAERSDKNRLPEEVMKAADKALYRSKKAGRNRVTLGK